MQRVNLREILDSNDCPPAEIAASLQDMCLVNRWFGGVATTRNLIERVANATSKKHFSWLEVAAGFGEVPRAAGKQLESKGITLDITDLDRAPTHLRQGGRALAADALSLPFRDNSFDVVGCSLFAHHLEPNEVAAFVDEAARVSRQAVLINDLIRHPLHLALVYAGFPLMKSYVSRFDGVASVKRSYLVGEMRQILSNGNSSARRIELSRHYLFRMGVIVWKQSA